MIYPCTTLTLSAEQLFLRAIQIPYNKGHKRSIGPKDNGCWISTLYLDEKFVRGIVTPWPMHKKVSYILILFNTLRFFPLFRTSSLTVCREVKLLFILDHLHLVQSVPFEHFYIWENVRAHVYKMFLQNAKRNVYVSINVITMQPLISIVSSWLCCRLIGKKILKANLITF